MFIRFNRIVNTPEGPRAAFTERDAKPIAGLTLLYDLLNPPVHYAHGEDWINEHLIRIGSLIESAQESGKTVDSGTTATMVNLRAALRAIRGAGGNRAAL